jgi:cAMP-dependent protein kinase regulator
MRSRHQDVAEQVREHKDRAVELTASGRIEAALAEYLRALALLPGDVFARQRAAEILARLGRGGEAIDHYLGLVGKYAVEGRLLKAIATCHLILQLDPAHAATLTTLGDLYAERAAPRSPVRIPPGMAGALPRRDSEPPPHVRPETLARVPLFSELARAPFESLARRFARIVVPPGETIVEEGRPGDAIFAVAHGVVRVERRGAGPAATFIAEMAEGEFFGEMSLVSGCPRLATVSAVTECELLRLGRTDLEQIVAFYPHVGVVLQNFFKERLAANLSRASPLFRELPEEGQRALTELFSLETYAPETVLLEQGKPGGAGLFFLLRGQCDVFHRRDDGLEEPYPQLVEGDVFGEVSLLQGGPITASVRTASPCVVLGLHREWVDELLLSYPPVRDAIYSLASRRLERTQALVSRERLD